LNSSVCFTAGATEGSKRNIWCSDNWAISKCWTKANCHSHRDEKCTFICRFCCGKNVI